MAEVLAQLRGALILDSRIEIRHRSPPHVAAMFDFVIGAAAMQRAPVVPHYEIPRHPSVSIDELGLRGVFHQFVNQHSPVRNWLPDEVRGMRGEIQCLAS